MLFIYALTPLHAGAGRFGAAGGVVDLPIQRDEFDFPTIWSSSLKGVLRSNFQLKARSTQNPEERVACEAFVRATFGPEPASPEVSEYSSALSVLDARLLMVPARSLKGVWVYLTSPHLLNYYKVYLEIASEYNRKAGERAKSLGDLIKKIEERFRELGANAERTALVSDELCVIGVDQRRVVVLNEEEFSAELMEELNKQLWALLPDGLERRSLVVVTDNAVKRLVRRSLIIQPRIRLNYERKTVEQGGLWDEEYLPQRTLMVSLVIAKQPKMDLRALVKRIAESHEKNTAKAGELAERALAKLGKLDATEIVNKLSEWRYAVLGGKETVGKGIARLLWYS